MAQFSGEIIVTKDNFLSVGMFIREYIGRNQMYRGYREQLYNIIKYIVQDGVHSLPPVSKIQAEIQDISVYPCIHYWSGFIQ